MDKNSRIELAKKALLGVSIGDAFGDSFFGNIDQIQNHIINKTIPETTWEFTDDTIMSLAVYEELEQDGMINPNRFIEKICLNHNKDPNRGYGATARKIIREISEGGGWEKVASAVFDGQGSIGNGAAMRVCPIGAYYFDDFKMVKSMTILSAKVTHINMEAVSGAIAVATATALATKMNIEHTKSAPNDFINQILQEVPDSDTKSKIAKSKEIPYSYHTETIKSILGNGTKMTAQDTVPFVIWCAAHHLDNFETGLWKAISVLGDRDTICAMVGGILIMNCIKNSVPRSWLDNVEKLDISIFRSMQTPNLS